MTLELSKREINLILASLKTCYMSAPIGDPVGKEIAELYGKIKALKFRPYG